MDDKGSRIVDEVVAERKLNEVLVRLYKDHITQNKAEQLGAAVLGLLPRETQPIFRRQFPVRRGRKRNEKGRKGRDGGLSGLVWREGGARGATKQRDLSQAVTITTTITTPSPAHPLIRTRSHLAIPPSPSLRTFSKSARRAASSPCTACSGRTATETQRCTEWRRRARWTKCRSSSTRRVAPPSRKGLRLYVLGVSGLVLGEDHRKGEKGHNFAHLRYLYGVVLPPGQARC